MDQRFPVQLELEPRHGEVTQVSCGDRHSAILTNEHRVLLSGSNQHGQLGFGENEGIITLHLYTYRAYDKPTNKNYNVFIFFDRCYKNESIIINVQAKNNVHRLWGYVYSCSFT